MTHRDAAPRCRTAGKVQTWLPSLDSRIVRSDDMSKEERAAHIAFSQNVDASAIKNEAEAQAEVVGEREEPRERPLGGLVQQREQRVVGGGGEEHEEPRVQGRRV